MPLINCEINFILMWSSSCVITSSNREGKFTITYIKLYVPVVTLSTQDNGNLLEKLKSGFKSTVYWNKYQSNRSIKRQNPYLYYLIDPSFQGVNKRFVLFKYSAVRKGHGISFLLTVEIKVHVGKSFFDQPVKKSYENI